MRRFWFVFFLLWQLSLGGCAYLSSYSSNLPEKIDSLIEQQQYGRALDILEYVKPGDKDYAELMRKKQQLKQLTSKLVATTVRTGQNYISQSEWYKAQIVYEQALEKYPQSKKLQAAQKRFLQLREKYLQKLELSLLLNKANWLIGNAPAYKKIKHALPNDYERYPALRNYNQEVVETGDKLMSSLQQALADKDYQLARTCLRLAESIGSPKIDQQQLVSARKKLARVDRKRISQLNNQTRALIAELKQGYSHDNLRRARQQLDTLTKQKNANSETIQLQAELRTLFRKGINQGIAGGRRQYSQGHIEQALQIWTALSNIDPGNQKLAEHIERAEHVLQKLQRLNQKDTTIKPPAEQESKTTN